MKAGGDQDSITSLQPKENMFQEEIDQLCPTALKRQDENQRLSIRFNNIDNIHVLSKRTDHV